MWGESEPIGGEDQVIADFARGLQVFVEQRGRHGQRLAGVVETGCIGRIHGKLPCGTHVHAGKVADAVVVLGVAQAAQQHRPGITRVPSRLVHANAQDPVDYLLPGVRGWLWRYLRGHLLGGQFIEHQGPTRIVLDHRRHRGVWPEIELPGRRSAAMAHDAIAGKKRPHRLRKFAFQISVGDVDCAHRRSCGASKHRQQCDNEGATLYSTFLREPSHTSTRDLVFLRQAAGVSIYRAAIL